MDDEKIMTTRNQSPSRPVAQSPSRPVAQSPSRPVAQSPSRLLVPIFQINFFKNKEFAMSWTILLTLMLVGLFSSCGGGGGEGGGGAGGSSPPSTSPPSPRSPRPPGGGGGGTPAPIPINPWASVGTASISSSAPVTAIERQVEFGDGMTMSYDATDPENEEVCRIETAGGDSLSICMNLNDGEAEGDDFEGEITCSINGEEQADCDEVYQRLTAAGFSTSVALSPSVQGQTAAFSCEAGVFRGDKALECSDDWAVVANGEDGAGNGKTICRVHMTQETGRCLGAPKQVDTDNDGILDAEIAPQDLILEMQQTQWSGYASSYTNSGQVLINESIDPAALVDMPANAVLYFESRTPQVCSVDNDDDVANGTKGRVIPDPDISNKGMCHIVLKVEAPGFVDQVFERRIESVEDNDTSWDGYSAGGVLPIGEALMPNAPTNPIPTPFYIYNSATPNICRVDAGTGELAGLAGGNCRVRLTASSSTVPRGYLVREIISPPVAIRGEQSIVWMPVTSGVVGSNLQLDSVTGNAAGAVVTYEVVSPGTTGCNLVGQTLSFTGAGICRVRAIVTLSDYEDWGQVEEIVVSPGTQTGRSWTPTQSQGVVGTSLTLTAATGTGDADEVFYEISSNDDGSTSCAFERQTLSFSDAGTCTVRVRTERAGYDDWISADFAITVAAGTQSPAWSPQTVGTVGIPLTLNPVTNIDASATAAYAIVAGENTICTINGAVLTFVDDGTCTVQATVTRTGYTTWNSGGEDIGVAEGSISGVNWNPRAAFNAGDGSAALGGVTGTESGDTITYSVETQGGNCVFSDSTASTLGFDSPGICQVKVTVERDGYQDWVSPTFDIELVSAAPIVITWAGYTGGNVATVGVSAPGLSTPTYNPISPDDSAYEFISVPPGACSVDSTNGALTVSGVGSCVVTHTAEKSGSGNGRETVTVAIGPGIQTLTPGTPYTAPSTFAVGDTLVLGTAPTGAMESAGISYRSTDTAICTLASDGEVTATGAGSCVVQAQFAATANYNPSAWTQIFTVPVVRADQAAPAGTDVYGTSPALAARGTLKVQTAPSGGGGHGALTYASTTGTVCSVSAASGEVTALETGTCTITANWAGDANYNASPPLGVLSITISQGTQPAPAAAAAYGDNPTVKRGDTLAVASAPAGGAGTLAYTSTTTSICTVAGDGTVSGVSVGTCLISAQWPGDAHVAASDTVPLASIAVTRGDQAPPSASDIYGTSPTLSTGQVLAVASAPAGGGVGGTPRGSPRYQSTTETLCSVTEGSGVITALADGNCIVQARWGGDAQFLPSPWVTMQTVAITPIAFEMARWGEFSGKLTVGGGTKRPSKSRAKIRRVDFTYALKQNEADCTLEDAASGEVRASAVAFADPYCTIVATASRAGYTPLTRDIAILLQAGTLAFATAPSYSGALSVGTTLTVQNAESNDDNGIAVTWDYTAGGLRRGASAGGVCSVSATGEVSLGTSALVGDVCRVSISASAPGYEDFEVSPINLAFPVATQSGVAWSPPTNGKVGRNLDLGAIVFPAGFPSGSTTRYEVADAGATRCFFRGRQGVLAHTLAFGAAGTCKVRATNTHPQFGDWDSGEISILVSENTALPVQVVVGDHACARFDDNTLKCWGFNDEGQLGLGHSDNLGDNEDEMGGALPFVDVSADGNVKSVAVGINSKHTCAITTDDRVKCWGRNDEGQLGYGDNTDRTSPAAVHVDLGSGRTARQISLGENHTCALLDNNTIKCWGENGDGQLGYGNNTDLDAPHANAVTLGNNPDNNNNPYTAQAVSAGRNHTCALLDDGKIKCWGRNGNGQLGLGNISGTNLPGSVADLGNDGSNDPYTATALAAGNNHTCAVLNDGKVKCWGHNRKVGRLQGSDFTAPGGVVQTNNANNSDLNNAVAISAGVDHSCALLNNDSIKCWGENASGQLGLGHTSFRSTTGGHNWNFGSNITVQQIATGNTRSCALLSDDSVKCWGNNDEGQLGSGNTSRRTTFGSALSLLFFEKQSFNSLAWASFPASAEVGATETLSDPASDPGFDDWEASVLSGGCAWTQASKELEFTGTAPCVVSLVATKSGYLDTEQIFSVTPSPTSQTGIAWSPSQATGTVGTDLPLDAVTGADASATVTYEISDAGDTGCAFKGSSDPDDRTLIFLAAGTCQVIAKSSGENIEPWESPTPFSIAVKHPQTLTPPADAYGSTPTLIIPGTLVLQKFPRDGKKRPEFRPKDGDETYCKVDPHNGRVTPVAPGNCEVEVRWPEGTEYYASDWETLGTVAIQAPLQPQTGIAWSPSQNEGVVGEALELDAVTASDGNSAIEYLISSMGDTGCAFGSGDAQSKRTLSFSEAGTCTVQARSTLAGHFAWRSQTFSISVRHPQTLELPDDAPYGDNLNFFSGQTLALLNPPTGGDGALEFRTTAASANWCEVGPASGMVLGKGISQGDAQKDCVIEARWGETSTHYASEWATLATLTVLPPPDPLQTGLAWAASTAGQVGVELVLPPVTGADSSAVLTYTVSSPGTTACAWKDGDASTLTLRFTNAGTCVASVRSQRAGYQDWQASVSIAVAKGTQTGLAWAAINTAPTGKVGETTTLPAVTGADNGESVTYEKTTDAGNSICALSGRALTFSDSGTCIVQAVIARTSYQTLTLGPVSITVAKGTQTGLAWAAINTAPTGKVGETTTLPAVTGADNGESVTYEKTTDAGNSICTLSGRDLVFSDAGTCKVQALVARSGYDTLTLGPVSISVALGDLTGLSWSVGTTTFIKTATPVLPEVTGKQNGDTIVYAVTSQGSTSCAFGTGADVRKLAFTAAGTCKVQATLTRTGYNPWPSPEISLGITNADPVVIAWTGYGSGNNANKGKVGEAPPALQTPTLTPSDATPRYSTVSSGVCSVTSGGDLTITGKGDCVVKLTATPSDTNANVVTTSEITVAISRGDQSVTPANDPYGSSPDLKAGQGLALANAPTGQQESAATTYQSTDAAICAVDETDGEISAKKVGDCVVQAQFAQTANYEQTAWVQIASITIGKGTQVAPTASNPYGTSPALAVGGTLDIQTAPSGGGGHGGLEYESSFPAACTVDATSGQISGLKAQNCLVKVRWKGNDDYDASGFIDALTLTVGKGTQAAPTASSPYGSSPEVAVDADIVLDNAPTGGHGLPLYSSSDENVCGINSSNGTVRGVKEGTCQIKAHFRGDSDYLASPESTIATITVIKSNQDAPDASDIYGGSPTLITDGTLSLDTPPTGGGQEGDIEYRVLSTTSTICSVDSATGTVTALLDGTCTIEARWSGVDGEYNASPYATMQSFTIGKASIAGASWGSFSGNLKVGGATATPSASTFTTAGVGVSYAIKSGNTNCALESGGTTTGEVRANAVAITPGTPVYCVVVISAAKAGYNTKTQDIQIPLELGDLVLATAGFPTYTGTLSVGSAALNPQNPPATDDNNIALTWTYSVQGERFTAPQTGICAAVSGAVSIGNNARVGDVCKITATASATGYNDETSLVASINVVAATQAVTWNVPAATRSAAKIGGDLILPAPTGVPNGASVNYEVTDPGTAGCFFRFEGNRFTNKLGFTSPGTCKVKLVSTHERYGPWNSPEVEITVAANTATVAQIVAGGNSDDFEVFACARFSDGSLKCWGGNAYEQLGLGDDDNRTEVGSALPFVNLGTGRTAVQVALGNGGVHACAILDNGALKCWGSNASGELGQRHDNSVDGIPAAPVDLGNGKTARQVALGYEHTCAVLDDNSLKCWGGGFEGQLGNGKVRYGHPDGGGTSTFTPTTVDVGTGKTVRQVAVGESHTCALLDDFSVKCWGRNQHGQAGRGASGSRYGTPGAAVQLGTSTDGLTLAVQSIAMGHNHSCAITDGGGVKCWGVNDKGQLGIGNTTNKGRAATDMSNDLPFVNLGAGRSATMLSAGIQHTCALLDDGNVKCWGRNDVGQLGLGDTTDLHAPSATAIDLGTDDQNTAYTATAISVAEHFTCALLSHGQAKCWGENGQGQLGQGHTDTLGDAAGEMGNGLPFIDLLGNLSTHFTSLTWPSFPASATVGVDSSALSDPIADPTADSLNIRVIGGNCAWDSNGKKFSYTGTRPCQVAVAAEKTGYQDRVKLFSVTPTAGTQSGITWDAGAGEFALGTELVLGAVAGAHASADKEYAVVDAGSTGCSFKGTSGVNARTLTGISVGTCKVHARSVRSGYVTWVSQTVSIVIKRAQILSVPANSYGSTPQITPLGTLEIGTAPSSGHGTLEYRSKDTNICTVDGNGKVTAVALGDCEIEARWAGNSEYQPSGWAELATVEILLEQSGISWTPGASSGTVGIELALAPVSGADTAATVTYVIAHAGTTGCAWKGSDSTSRTLIFTDAGTCKVQAKSTRTGYLSWTSEVSIVVAKGTQTGITWSPTAAGTVGTELVWPAVSGADTAATVTYVITDAGATGCVWKGSDSTSRILIFTDAGTCKAQAKSTRTGYQTWTREISVVVAKGTQTGITWSPIAVGTVGVELVQPAVSGADTAATVAYVITDVGSTSCAWKGSDPTSRTLTFAGAGTCKVKATSTRTGYQLWELEVPIIITLPTQTLTVPAAPYGTQSLLLAKGNTRTMQNPPTGGHGTLSYRISPSSPKHYHYTNDYYCSVDSSGNVSRYAGRQNYTNDKPCIIEARWDGNENYQPSPWTEIETFMAKCDYGCS